MMQKIEMLTDYLFNFTEETPINATFKLIDTEITTNIVIDMNMTTEKFIKYVSEYVREEFKINQNYKIEIVKPMNTDYFITSDPEYAYAIRSSKLTLYDIYGDELNKQPVFYIRPKLGLYVNVKLINSLNKIKSEENEKHIQNKNYENTN